MCKYTASDKYISIYSGVQRDIINVIVNGVYKDMESQIPIVSLQMSGQCRYAIFLNDAFAIKVVQTFSCLCI